MCCQAQQAACGALRHSWPCYVRNALQALRTQDLHEAGSITSHPWCPLRQTYWVHWLSQASATEANQSSSDLLRGLRVGRAVGVHEHVRFPHAENAERCAMPDSRRLRTWAGSWRPLKRCCSELHAACSGTGSCNLYTHIGWVPGAERGARCVSSEAPYHAVRHKAGPTTWVGTGIVGSERGPAQLWRCAACCGEEQLRQQCFWRRTGPKPCTLNPACAASRRGLQQ